jgi:hypothetical protein
MEVGSSAGKETWLPNIISIVIERARLADCAKASVTVTVKVEISGLVGVPEMVPAGLSVRPPGSDPAETLQVRVPIPPVACNV